VADLYLWNPEGTARGSASPTRAASSFRAASCSSLSSGPGKKLPLLRT
jgi:hypothetical protein